MITKRVTRRRFVCQGTLAGMGMALSARQGCGRQITRLFAGQGVVDTTPPLGIELSGFHRLPGQGRLITGIRQPTAARVLVLRAGDVLAVLVSLDITAVGRSMARRVQGKIGQRLGIPAAHVRICTTHSHSMPTLRFFRQWGAISPEYMAIVEQRILRAAELAQADLAPAELYVGKSRAEGANFNRTAPNWKTDQEFSPDSTDAQRWLDTKVHTLHFRRPGEKHDLLWYHFSAHPVCYTDNNAGPDWPGLVEQYLRENDNLSPSLLQGHCGDVNPGDGDPWLGVAESTAERVAAAIRRALDSAEPVKADRLQVQTQDAPLSLDMELFGRWLEAYRTNPANCGGGEWVDPPFAKDWFDSASKWDLKQTRLPVALSAMRLGDVGLVFHPSELYSYYGLAIQRDCPLPNVLVVGYTDDCIGYLPDPNAYQGGEYAATTVPKICDLPPFQPTAAAELTEAALKLLNNI